MFFDFCLLSHLFLSSTFRQNPGSSRVWLLATDGPPGQAALGDSIDPLRDRERAEVVGWARFEKEKEKTYRSKEEVEADKEKQLVVCASSDSNRGSSIYGWREGVTEALYGWKVAEVKRTEEGGGRRELLVPGKRLLRSVYTLGSSGCPA